MQKNIKFETFRIFHFSFSNIEFLFRETILGLRRGGWMNWATVSTVTVLLFLFGLNLLASWCLDNMLDNLGGQLEISAYLESEVVASDLEIQVLDISGVTSVEFISKEEAWSGLVHELGLSSIEEATHQIQGNPLVDELKVKVRIADEVASVASALSKIDGINEVQYVQEIINRLAQLSEGLKLTSLFMITILSFTATSVIMTTIRLTILARRREIEVMQLVGAIRKLIYFPFLCQGAILGSSGAILACIILFLFSRIVNSIILKQPEFVQYLTSSLQLSMYENFMFSAMLTGLGAVLGLVGSFFAVDKFSLR